jgi:hypothetical protein
MSEETDQRSADMRDAALLNAIAVAKDHGLSPDWTDGDIARWRWMRTHMDAISSGSNAAETIPQGFGPAVRTRQTEVLMGIATRMAAEMAAKMAEEVVTRPPMPNTSDAPPLNPGARPPGRAEAVADELVDPRVQDDPQE